MRERQDVMVKVRHERDEITTGPFPLPIEPMAGDIIGITIPSVNLDGLYLVQRREIYTEGTESAYPVIVVADLEPASEEVMRPDPELDEWQFILDGVTDEDTAVKCWWKPGAAYGQYRVEVDGTEVHTARVDRMRDGGTTVVQLTHAESAWPVEGYKLVFPRRAGSDDRIPRFAGRKVE